MAVIGIMEAAAAVGKLTSGIDRPCPIRRVDETFPYVLWYLKKNYHPVGYRAVGLYFRIIESHCELGGPLLICLSGG